MAASAAIGRHARAARFVVLLGGWVVVWVCMAHRLLPLIGVVGVVALFSLFWLERSMTPRRSVPEAILRAVSWVVGSLLALLLFFFLLLVVATLGAELGLWGSPWDGR
jgi:hypothetical protein